MRLYRNIFPSLIWSLQYPIHTESLEMKSKYQVQWQKQNICFPDDSELDRLQHWQLYITLNVSVTLPNLYKACELNWYTVLIKIYKQNIRNIHPFLCGMKHLSSEHKLGHKNNVRPSIASKKILKYRNKPQRYKCRMRYQRVYSKIYKFPPTSKLLLLFIELELSANHQCIKVNVTFFKFLQSKNIKKV